MAILLAPPACVALILALTASAPSWAQEQGAWSDDFSTYAEGADGTPRWQPLLGKWTVANGAYLQSRTAQDETLTFLADPVVSDFDLRVRFFVHPVGSGVKAAGIVWRAVSSAQHYLAHYDSKFSQLLVYRMDAPGAYAELARIRNVTISPEQWHEAQVTGTGGHMAIYLDGQLLAEVEDGTYPAGWIGLRTGQGRVAFDDFTLAGTPATLHKEWTVMAGHQESDEYSVPRLEEAERVIAVKGGGYFPVLIRLDDGRLGAVVRGGDAHVGIKGRLDWIESSDGGRTWSAPRVIVDSEWDDRNPAVGQMPREPGQETGTIVVAYAECRAYNAQGQYDTGAGEFVWYTVLSYDGGKTWSAKRPLTRGPIGGGGSPYGRIITLADGSALMSVYGDRDPHYTGPIAFPPDCGPWVCGLLRSRDRGETWEDFSLISALGHNETTLLEMPDGSLLAAMRTTGESVDVTVSSDMGRTWAEPISVTGVNQHPADLLRLQSGNLLMVYGNRVEPYGVGAVLSYNGGKTWDWPHRVLIAWTSENIDCGYPSVVQLDDGTIVCLYYSVGTEELPGEWQAIAVRFTEDQLRAAAGL